MRLAAVWSRWGRGAEACAVRGRGKLPRLGPGTEGGPTEKGSRVRAPTPLFHERVRADSHPLSTHAASSNSIFVLANASFLARPSWCISSSCRITNRRAVGGSKEDRSTGSSLACMKRGDMRVCVEDAPTPGRGHFHSGQACQALEMEGRDQRRSAGPSACSLEWSPSTPTDSPRPARPSNRVRPRGAWRSRRRAGRPLGT